MGRLLKFALVVGIASALYFLKKGRDDTIDEPEPPAASASEDA